MDKIEKTEKTEKTDRENREDTEDREDRKNRGAYRFERFAESRLGHGLHLKGSEMWAARR